MIEKRAYCTYVCVSKKTFFHQADEEKKRETAKPRIRFEPLKSRLVIRIEHHASVVALSPLTKRRVDSVSSLSVSPPLPPVRLPGPQKMSSAPRASASLTPPRA